MTEINMCTASIAWLELIYKYFLIEPERKKKVSFLSPAQLLVCFCDCRSFQCRYFWNYLLVIIISKHAEDEHAFNFTVHRHIRAWMSRMLLAMSRLLCDSWALIMWYKDAINTDSQLRKIACHQARCAIKINLTFPIEMSTERWLSIGYARILCKQHTTVCSIYL